MFLIWDNFEGDENLALAKGKQALVRFVREKLIDQRWTPIGEFLEFKVVTTLVVQEKEG